MKYRAWLEAQITLCEEAAHRHRGVGAYQGHVAQWRLKADVLHEALAELHRQRGANAPVWLARAA